MRQLPVEPDGLPDVQASRRPTIRPTASSRWGYIRNAINKGGVTAYNAWNMVLDSGGKGNDTTGRGRRTRCWW